MSTHRFIVAVVTLLGSLATEAARAATITVDTKADSQAGDGFCSLREAIHAANDDAPFNGCTAGAGADTIVLAPTGKIFLNAALPPITGTTVLQGPGASLLAIDGGRSVQLLLSTGAAGEVLTVRGLTLAKGHAMADGGAIDIIDGDLLVEDVTIEDCSAVVGGAISTNGSGLVKIVRSTLRRNTAAVGGGVYAPLGATVIIEATTFYANVATMSGAGLAIWQGRLEARHSTFSGNSSEGHGGGLDLHDTAATVNSCTITGNRADDEALDAGSGGGISVSDGAVLDIKNSIVAQNQDLSVGISHPDISRRGAGAVTSRGFNLVGVNAGVQAEFPEPAVANRPNVNSDFVGVHPRPLDPQLGKLLDNGGPTLTHLPFAGLVIDRGACDSAAVDQRGYHGSRGRPFDQPTEPNLTMEACDIGAVENGALP